MLMQIRPGPRNLITDVDGILVGNAHCANVRSGVTVVLPQMRCVAGCDARGGAPGTRETDALDPMSIADAVDAIVLSGGSTYGLDAGSGATGWLGARGRGFSLAAGPRVSPIVPTAILFDLPNGGDKGWGETPPYHDWAVTACASAGMDFALGNSGAGMGAMVGNLKGGLGSASAFHGSGLQVGALAAVNAFGSSIMPGSDRLWAAPFEIGGEYGGRGLSPIEAVSSADPFAGTRAELGAIAGGGHTTIGVVATNAALTKVEAKRVAIMAQDGLSRAIRPIHSQVDGDVVFALSTGRMEIAGDRLEVLMRLGAIAADCFARAVGRGVYAAENLGDARCYRSRYHC
jgi:L-aminopeptidase/D-esterase-like protein